MGREYDQGGLDDWVGKIKKGWKRQQIFNGFANSREFSAICQTYGITQGTKISIPALETVVPFEKCSECGAAGLKKYTITYKLNSGTLPSTGVKKWYTVESASYTLPKPTRSGYTFMGWYKESSFTNKVTSIPNGSTGNKTFYAKWKKN
ncbi:MAG: InlB B-repeat-containing protein [Lachnospiraceae bacterium]|nr:InlB B-repeat-containing protein [Lachnospiraceae bacterium]